MNCPSCEKPYPPGYDWCPTCTTQFDDESGEGTNDE